MAYAIRISSEKEETDESTGIVLSYLWSAAFTLSALGAIIHLVDAPMNPLVITFIGKGLISLLLASRTSLAVVPSWTTFETMLSDLRIFILLHIYKTIAASTILPGDLSLPV